jgi:hypothetical protein
MLLTIIIIALVCRRTYNRVAGSSGTCAHSLRMISNTIDFAVECGPAERIDSETADLCDRFIYRVWQENSYRGSRFQPHAFGYPACTKFT